MITPKNGIREITAVLIVIRLISFIPKIKNPNTPKKENIEIIQEIVL
jgi:hypothetical protein